MRKGILVALLTGFTFASIANAAEMVRYERDYYADDNSSYSQPARTSDYDSKKNRTAKSKDTRFDSQYRSKHPINWAAKERN